MVLSWKIVYNWCMFHCHGWLPEGLERFHGRLFQIEFVMFCTKHLVCWGCWRLLESITSPIPMLKYVESTDPWCMAHSDRLQERFQSYEDVSAQAPRAGSRGYLGKRKSTTKIQIMDSKLRTFGIFWMKTWQFWIFFEWFWAGMNSANYRRDPLEN